MDFPAPTIVLTDDQIEFYHREGYLTVASISTPEEIDRLRGIYDGLFSRRAGRDVGDQFDLGGTDEEGSPATLPQILGPSRYAPELKTGVFRANADALARQLLGPDAVFMGDHAIFKPALIGAATPWHQDEAYWNPQMEYNSFSLWMPLQPATIENGCMQFVPRSHQLEVLPHHSINNDPRIHGLEVDSADTSGAVPCPLAAGGATIHHNRTLHYAGPNSTDIPRRAYIMGYGTPARQRAETRVFYWNDTKQTPRQARADRSKSAEV